MLTVVRTKILSLLVGPAGLGLMGAFNSIVTMAGTIAGLGISNSGVRQIADAVGSGDGVRLALTVATLRRTGLVLGVVGMLALIAFSGPICRLVFGDATHQRAVILLSFCVLFGVVQSAQAALIQGLRRIRDSAKLNVLAGIYATVFSVPLVYWLRADGIAPFLVAAALAGMIASWYYARHVPSATATMGMGREVVALMRLGSAVLLSAGIATISALLLRTLIMRKAGLVGLGIYQAGSGIALLYVNFILQAMGTDFYPRLTSAPAAGPERSRLVNEQAEISLLFALPGILGTFVLAPLVIHAFYSPAFMAAVVILKWHLLGMLLRVVGFPVGYLALAWGDAVTFSLLEISFGILQVGTLWAGLRFYGLDGAGIAFFVLNLVYLPTQTVVALRRYHFRWKRDNIQLWGVTTVAVAAVWTTDILGLNGRAPIASLAVVAVAGSLCLKQLHRRLGNPPWTHLLAAVRSRVPLNAK